MKKTSNKNTLNMNVILTFNNRGGEDDSYQEIFDLNIRIKKYEIGSITFLNKEIFPEIFDFCFLIERSPGDLIKISTAANWSDFERITGKKPIGLFGHSYKWHFGSGRDDLDIWEMYLIETYGFGKDADMSWVNDLRQKHSCDQTEAVSA